MNKFWIVYSSKVKKGEVCDFDCYGLYGSSNGSYTSKPMQTLADAVAHAKQQTSMNLGRVYVILEAMEATVPPVPEVMLTTLTTATPVAVVA